MHAYRPNIAWHTDILCLPPDEGFCHLIVFCDIYSPYIFARESRTKSAADVATALTEIVLEHQIAPRWLISDLGGEFQNQIMEVLASCFKTTRIALRPSQKDSNFAEATHRRIIQILRRNFQDSTSWRGLYKQAVFSINVAEMRVGNELISPLELHSGFPPEVLPTIDKEHEDLEASGFHFRRIAKIHETLELVCKIRNTHSPLLICTEDNQVYTEGEEILVWREFVQKQKLTGVALLKHKLMTRWEKATVLKRQGDQYLIQIMAVDKQRIVHRRIMRKMRLGAE